MKTKGKLVDLVRSKTYTSSAGPLRMAAAVGRKIRDHRRLDTEEKGAKSSLVFKTELIIKNSSMYSLFPLYRVVWKVVVLSTDGDI